jgi:hypothetical protein
MGEKCAKNEQKLIKNEQNEKCPPERLGRDNSANYYPFLIIKL